MSHDPREVPEGVLEHGVGANYILRGNKIMSETSDHVAFGSGIATPVDESVGGYVQGGDPTVGRPMTDEDGEAGRLVVDLRNLVAQLEDECEALRRELDRRDKSAKYLHVEDPNYVEPETVTTTTSTFPDPNRFDPFEALDTIAKTVEMDDELDRDDADTIQRQVHALRAYITGLER